MVVVEKVIYIYDNFSYDKPIIMGRLYVNVISNLVICQHPRSKDLR